MKILVALGTVVLAAVILGAGVLGAGALDRLPPHHVGVVTTQKMKEEIHNSFVLDENSNLQFSPWDQYVPGSCVAYSFEQSQKVGFEWGKTTEILLEYVEQLCPFGDEGGWLSQLRVDYSQMIAFLPDTTGKDGDRVSLAFTPATVLYFRVTPGPGHQGDSRKTGSIYLEDYAADTVERFLYNNEDRKVFPTEFPPGEFEMPRGTGFGLLPPGTGFGLLPEQGEAEQVSLASQEPSFSSQIEIGEEWPSSGAEQQVEYGWRGPNPLSNLCMDVGALYQCYATNDQEMALVDGNGIGAYARLTQFYETFLEIDYTSLSRGQETILAVTPLKSNGEGLVVLFYHEGLQTFTGFSLQL